jgi:hypothetical protein
MNQMNTEGKTRPFQFSSVFIWFICGSLVSTNYGDRKRPQYHKLLAVLFQGL